MIKKTAETQFGSFNDNAEADVSPESLVGSPVPPHFLDSDRVNLYLTLSGLLEAGIPTSTALMLVQTEAKAQNRKASAELISDFFAVVRKARDTVKDIDASADQTGPTDVIGEAAERCFGKNFMSADELVLLRGLAHTDNAPAILRAAADIIRNKTLTYSPARPTASIGRRF